MQVELDSWAARAEGVAERAREGKRRTGPAGRFYGIQLTRNVINNKVIDRLPEFYIFLKDEKLNSSCVAESGIQLPGTSYDSVDSRNIVRRDSTVRACAGA